MEALRVYFQQADAISLATALALLLMSMLTWTVILLKYSNNRRQRRAEQRFLGPFWQRCNPADPGVELPADTDHALGRLAQAGLAAARHGSGPSGSVDLDRYVTRALRQRLDAENAALDYGLTVLASVGSTAPFVGLFGTVWSIHHALLALGSSAQATLDQVAGPVGEALVMTGAGLAVAIPAVIAYNLFTRANRLRLLALDAFAYDLHAVLVVGMSPPAVPSVPPKPASVAAPVALTEHS